MSDLKNKLLAEVNKVKRYEESSMEGGGVHECGEGPFVRVSHVRNAIKRVLDRPQPEATAPAMTPDYSEMSREALERHAARMAQQLANDKPRQFYDKHATGPMLPPSCLCCGKLPDKIAIRHAELPGIVICEECRTGTAPAQDLSAAILALPCLGTMSQFASLGDLKLYQEGYKEALEAAAALAASVNALSAGDRVDAERYRWLCEDHADPATRERRNNVLEFFAVRSYSANSMCIDTAILQSQKDPQ